MTDLLEELYPNFLDLGYSPALFWECSLAEILDLFESYTRREERRLREKKADFKDRVNSLQVLALQISEAIFAKDASGFRTVENFYPSLFPATQEGKEDRELIRRNEKMRRWAAEHNARWRQAHGKEES